MPTSQRRSVQLKSTITPELAERLRVLSVELCIPPATLVAYAVAQFVRQNEIAAKTSQVLGDQVGVAVRNALAEASSASQGIRQG